MDYLVKETPAITKARASGVQGVKLIYDKPYSSKYSKGRELRFEVTGSTGKKYNTSLYFKDKHSHMSDVRARCSCPYFKWWGSGYNARNEGYRLRQSSGDTIEPNIRDPKRKNKLCKHLIATLEEVPKLAEKWVQKEFPFMNEQFLLEMSLSDLQGEIAHLSTIGEERASILLFKKGTLVSKERIDLTMGNYRTTGPVPIDKVKAAVKEHGADEIFFIHNHPSGMLIPSKPDVRFSGALRIDLAPVKTRNFIVSGENIGAYGTNFVKPSWIEYDTTGAVIDRYSTPGKEDKLGLKIRVPAGTEVFSKNKRGKTLRAELVDAIKDSNEKGAFYGFKLGSQVYWAKEKDVEVIKPDQSAV